MKKIYPSHMDENFGIGAAEERLEHLTIEPVFEPFVQQIVDMSKNCLGGAINWIDANLHTVIRDTMRDDEGNEIDEECTDTTYRVEEGRVTVVIYDQNGAKAYFELGHADSIWPGKLSNEAQAKPRVLVTVRYGVADYVGDDGVDVEIFDFDNHLADPVGTAPVPTHFADLAESMDVPVQQAA